MTIECSQCNSIFDLDFIEDRCVKTEPFYCPFCGENLESDYSDSEDYLAKVLKMELGYLKDNSEEI